MQTTLSQSWREITINRKKIVDAERISNGRVRFVDHERSADECHTGEGLVRQIGEALEAGVRVLLVAIRDCEGGDVVAADRVEASTEAMVSDFVRRTKQKPEQIRKWLEGDFYMPAAEAVRLGFADRIEGEEAKPLRRVAVRTPATALRALQAARLVARVRRARLAARA